MLFRMITPRVTKTRSVVIRKGIPKDVRDEYQRLYGQRWEAKLSLPAGTKNAKVRVSEFTAEVESRIATIRAAQRGEGQSLTQRQALARRRVVRLVRRTARGEPRHRRLLAGDVGGAASPSGGLRTRLGH